MSTFLKYPTPSFLIFVFSLIQKVEISKVLFFLFFAAPFGIQDLSFPPKEWTLVPCSGNTLPTTRQPGNYHELFFFNIHPLRWMLLPVLLMKKWRLREVVNVVQLFVGKDLNMTFQINRHFWLVPHHSPCGRVDYCGYA